MRHVWEPLTVAEVRTLLPAVEGRWWLSGGCALDLWLEYQSREHGDIDVSVLRSDWSSFADALPSGLETFVAEHGALRPLDGSRVSPSVHNLWIRDRDTRSWVLQANLEEGDNHGWTYRRHPLVTRGWEDAVWSSEGLLVVNPAVQLLWKAAGSDEKRGG